MFKIAFDRVFHNEGGFQNDPNDRGNWTSGAIGEGELKGTKYGISAMSYPNIDIENMTFEDAQEIYRVDWWQRLRMDSFPTVLQYQIFDAAINHGMRNAIIILQRAIGANADGVIGPRTRLMVSKLETNDLALSFIAERLVFITNIRTWDRYGKGWARRIAHNLKMAAIDN